MIKRGLTTFARNFNDTVDYPLSPKQLYWDEAEPDEFQGMKMIPMGDEWCFIEVILPDESIYSDGYPNVEEKLPLYHRCGEWFISRVNINWCCSTCRKKAPEGLKASRKFLKWDS